MTLVVGYADGVDCYLVSDTLLTPGLEVAGNPIGPVNGEFHALKVHILAPHLAVAFATNDVDRTISIVHGLQNLLASQEGNAPSYLMEQLQLDNEAANQPPLDASFLILELTRDTSRLWLVNKDSVQPRTRAYIGDAAAFGQMTDRREPADFPAVQSVQQPDGSFLEFPFTPSEMEREFVEISNALETLSAERIPGSLGGIGGNVVRVTRARISGDLEYLELGESWNTPWEGPGGFSYLTSNSGTRGLALYYFNGHLGFVLRVADPDYCHMVHAASIGAFKVIAHDSYGMNLVGPTPAG